MKKKICSLVEVKEFKVNMEKRKEKENNNNKSMDTSSTMAAATDYMKDLLRDVNKGHISVSAYLGCSKAFDPGNYRILITKLDNIDFKGICTEHLIEEQGTICFGK